MPAVTGCGLETLIPAVLAVSAHSSVLASLEGAALLWYQLSPLCSAVDCTCRALWVISSLPAVAVGWHFSSACSAGPVHGVFVKRDLGGAEGGKEALVYTSRDHTAPM